MPALARPLVDERNLERGLNFADETLHDLDKQTQKIVVED